MSYRKQSRPQYRSPRRAKPIRSLKRLKRAADNPEQTAFLKQQNERELKANPDLKPLKEKLLSLGGDFVALQFEPDLNDILKRGQVFDGKKASSIRWPASHCHANVATLWDRTRNTRNTKIVTGWALSNDGIWRQHSWLLETVVGEERVLETTAPRAKYFGFVLTDDEAFKFWVDNR